MKKLIAFGASAALLAVTAMPVFAHRHHHKSQDELKVYNSARVYNDIYTKADTGDNEIGGKYVGCAKIETGKATAISQLYTQANWTEASCKNCGFDEVKVYNRGKVRNEVTTKADTGDNEIGGKCVRCGMIDTGHAYAASIVDSVVNTTMLK